MTVTCKESQGRKLYLRSCSYCNKGISVGYVWDNGGAYGCDNCYIKHLIAWTIDLHDNEYFRMSEDKEEFISDILDQIYVGWAEDDDDGTYFDSEGNDVIDLNPLDEIVYGIEVYDQETLNYNWVEQTKGEIDGQI